MAAVLENDKVGAPELGPAVRALRFGRGAVLGSRDYENHPVEGRSAGLEIVEDEGFLGATAPDLRRRRSIAPWRRDTPPSSRPTNGGRSAAPLQTARSPPGSPIVAAALCIKPRASLTLGKASKIEALKSASASRPWSILNAFILWAFARLGKYFLLQERLVDRLDFLQFERRLWAWFSSFIGSVEDDSMRPRERRDSGQSDLFKARLDQIVDLNHPLAKLARRHCHTRQRIVWFSRGSAMSSVSLNRWFSSIR
jgi:hypothetical protein